MREVVLHLSMSVDAFIAGPDDEPVVLHLRYRVRSAG